MQAVSVCMCISVWYDCVLHCLGAEKKPLPTCRLSVSVWKALFPSEWVITSFFPAKVDISQKVPVWPFMSAWTKHKHHVLFAVPWCNASHVIWWIVAYAIRERLRERERERERERGERERESKEQQQPSATAKVSSILRWATHWQGSVIQWTLQYACGWEKERLKCTKSCREKRLELILY